MPAARPRAKGAVAHSRIAGVKDSGYAPVMGMTMPAPSRLPPGRRVYAIGDVHGCLGQLVQLHALIEDDLTARPVEHPVLVHLGDYVDRGADSAGVVRELLAAKPRIRTVNLLGNHEQMMLEAAATGDPESFTQWLHNGGTAALRSWGVSPDISPRELKATIPSDHLSFLSKLALQHREGGYLFVHAGIRPGRRLEAQIAYDLIWIREPFLSWEGDHGIIVVHGHTPMQGPVVKSNRIGIDTGAVLGGPLTCLVLEEDRLRFLFA